MAGRVAEFEVLGPGAHRRAASQRVTSTADSWTWPSAGSSVKTAVDEPAVRIVRWLAHAMIRSPLGPEEGSPDGEGGTVDHNPASPPQAPTTPYSAWQARTGAAVVSMPSRIDSTNCDQAHAALTRAVESGSAVVIADLTRTSFCSYTGAAALVSVHARAARAGRRLRVAAAGPNARLIRKIAGTSHVIDCYPDLTAALTGPRSRGTTRGITASGRRLSLIPDTAARRSAGKLARRLSAVPPPGQTPPPGPPRP